MANQSNQGGDGNQKSGDRNTHQGSNREGGAQGGNEGRDRVKGDDRHRGTSNLRDDDDAAKDAQSFGTKGEL